MARLVAKMEVAASENDARYCRGDGSRHATPKLRARRCSCSDRYRCIVIDLMEDARLYGRWRCHRSERTVQQVQSFAPVANVGFASRAIGGEMSLKILQFLAIERAEGVDVATLAPMFMFGGHYAAWVPSIPLRRRIPERILVLTVPSGSASRAAISVWLKPSK